ncbi:MAG: DUF4097 domain-containing protein [Candidatus Aminicenantes bacterium]|nr:DUF4097 domain-containing protein [Candidatus Aminicenantes bacterium]
MRAREVILLLFIIAAGVTVHEIQHGNLPIFWDFEEGILWNAEEFSFEETLTVEPPFPTDLAVQNAHGRVDVQGAETDRITITLTKRIYRKNEADARAVSDRLRAVLRKDPGRVFLSTTRDEIKKRRNFETDFQIVCPARMAVTVDNSYGDVMAVGLGALSVDNPHGTVSASDVSGPVSVINGYQDVELLRCGADVSIDSRHSKITVREVQGKLHLIQRYGSIQFEKITGEVEIDAPHTDITGLDSPSALKIANSYEPIRLTNSGPVRIEADHSDFEAENIRGNCEVRDSYGRIRLTDVEGSLLIDGRSLSVTGQKLRGADIQITSSYESVDLKEFSGRTTIRLSHADLALTPTLLSGPIDVQAEYTGIHFYWPKGERYPLEARSRGGRVNWNLDAPSQTEGNGTFILRAFADAVGKPEVKLATTYEDIVIEE